MFKLYIFQEHKVKEEKFLVARAVFHSSIVYKAVKNNILNNSYSRKMQ